MALFGISRLAPSVICAPLVIRALFVIRAPFGICAPFSRSRRTLYLPTPIFNDSEFTFDTLYSTASRATDSWTEAPTIA